MLLSVVNLQSLDGLIKCENQTRKDGKGSSSRLFSGTLFWDIEVRKEIEEQRSLEDGHIE